VALGVSVTGDSLFGVSFASPTESTRVLSVLGMYKQTPCNYVYTAAHLDRVGISSRTGSGSIFVDSSDVGATDGGACFDPGVLVPSGAISQSLSNSQELRGKYE